MKDRIEAGDRVRSNEGFDAIPYEGVVQSIAVGCTRQGPAPILRVMVDKKDGQTVEPHLHESAAVLWDKILEDGTVGAKTETAGPKCPSCGEVHGTDPFTPELFALYEQLKALPPDEDREEILSEMAERFMANIEQTDYDLPDWLHRMIEKADDAEERMRRAILRVGRMVARNLSEMEKAKAVQGHILKVMIMPFPPSGEDKGGGGGLN